MTGPRWLEIARGELGVAEVQGPGSNPRVIEYHAATTLKATSDDVPWCSAFVNWVMAQAGVKGTGSAAARSWTEWGQACRPAEGCVVVLSRGPGPTSGHVGLLVRIEPKAGRVVLLGGNQGDKVSVAAFPVSRVLAFRWPAGLQVPPE